MPHSIIRHMNLHEQHRAYWTQILHGAPITREFLERLNEIQRHIETYGNNFSAILFGEEHENNTNLREQQGFISNLKPQYVLHEGMAGYIYDGSTQKLIRQQEIVFNFMDSSPWHQTPEEYKYSAQQYGYKIVGCDLTSGETQTKALELVHNFPDTYYLDDLVYYQDLTYRQVVRRGSDPLKFNIRTDERINSLRDLHMAKTILHYVQLSSKPIVIILGAAHVRRIHANKLIQNKGIEYAAIDQCTGLGPYFGEFGTSKYTPL